MAASPEREPEQVGGSDISAAAPPCGGSRKIRFLAGATGERGQELSVPTPFFWEHRADVVFKAKRVLRYW